MTATKADKQADISAVVDRGESTSLMMPMRLPEDSRHRGALLDRAVELASKSAGFRRSLPGGEVGDLLGLTPRQGRRIVGSLLDREALVSDSPRAPLRLAFPATLAARWMPGLFPERAHEM